MAASDVVRIFWANLNSSCLPHTVFEKCADPEIRERFSFGGWGLGSRRRVQALERFHGFKGIYFSLPHETHKRKP